MSLARDALSSGDIVAAESYLQYAEHYNRIVMAAQSQASPQSAQPADQANGGGRPQQNAEAGGGENSDPKAADAGTGIGPTLGLVSPGCQEQLGRRELRLMKTLRRRSSACGN